MMCTKTSLKWFGGSTYILCLICVLSLVQRSCGKAALDPSEVIALNTIFGRWGISVSNTWNISGEPCSGVAIGSTPTIDNLNPGIKCDCSFNNESTCHITGFRVYARNVAGAFPEELQTFAFLTNLNLGQNCLTGPLPAFIGNLTRMQYLSIGINALSGDLPKEIGNLASLVSFGFGSNNFSGPLPSELGNLINLEQLYFDSAGVSGEIPSSFSNLLKLKTVWASDTQLTGKVPDFIGNWTKLESLRFQGNSFSGSIPISFSKLIGLTDLRLSELSNGSSTLEFIKDMKNLTILILRNNNISDVIPSNIGEYRSLAHLDLSFNSLSGQLPRSIFNLSTLAFLFLGNNKLSGSLPSQKNEALKTIDLSYNEISGNLPSWSAEQGLELNLVANNLTISSNNSGVSSGLYCLQRNFPCNRDSPRYSSFAIKCGGPRIVSSDKTVFEMDNATLGPATYLVTETNTWAISNAGRFTESNNALYTRSHSAQFSNTLDSELFQTARLSPGSLRYYGLGLENGNYTVNMQFSETLFPDSTWHSHGRRIFDIYLQGELRFKDFDIRKEAGGVSFRAVNKDLKALVTQNFLDIHLFWAGKGTCCIPAQGTYGPSISAIKVTPDFTPTVSNKPPATSEKKKRTGLIVGISVSVVAIAISLIAFWAVYVIRKRKRRALNEDEALLGVGPRPHTFSYDELRSATEDFKLTNKLGEGGFGPVFKGKLSDGRDVAVKQLSVSSHQGKRQFITEIATISAVQHRNLVKLHGCCIEGDKRLLVYEYHENKSLDQALFGKSGLHLDWSTRYDICLRTAKGLAYLHEESRPRIVHRDVKASNILIDADLNPKISDFGLAKLYDDKKTHISTRVAGTIGYLAPEYAMRGHLTEKADVFGFGVVALEVLSGRPNSDPSLDEDKIYLLEWAWNLHENNRGLELVDPTISDFDKEEAKRILGISLLCTQASPMLRPPMSRVVAMLSGDIEISNVTSKPGYLTDWQFNDLSSFMSQDTSGTSTSMPGTTSTQSGSLLNPTVVAEPDHSTATESEWILQEIIGEDVKE